MNKLNYLILLGIIPIWTFAQQITINPAPAPGGGYTVDYLVNEVLIEGDCAQVDNITSPINSLGNNSFNSFGYFERNGSSFPFDDGIVLASNDVDRIPDDLYLFPPFDVNTWGGDPDLAALNGQASNNATVIEFDFVPFVNEISFNYLMASQEYTGGFPCTFEDSFAFIISGPYDADGNLIIDTFPDGTPGVFQNANPYNTDANPNTPDEVIDMGGLNIATLPGTNIPATITNIHNLTTCTATQPGFFAAAQFFDQNNPASHDYNGQTVPLTASTPVIAGQIYKIKLAVADSRDSAYPSAVFIEGESFNLGDIDLGDPITLEDPEAQCTGLPIMIDTGLPDDTEIVFEWFRGDLGTNPTELIEGAEGPSYEATETGSYCVFAFIPNPTGGPVSCFNTGCINIEFFDEPEATLEDGLICQDGTAEIDATPDNIDTLLDQDPNGPAYTWFLDGAEIDGETEALLVADSPGVYEVEIEFNTCIVVLESTLSLVDYDMTLGEDVESCVSIDEEPSFEIIPEFTNIDEEDEDDVSYEWSTGETTPTIVVETSGTYSLTTTFDGCEVTDEVEVLFLPIPDVNLENIAICDDSAITLDATPSNISEINDIDEEEISYTWFQNGEEIVGEENATLVVSEPDFYSVEVNFFSCSIVSDAEVFAENYFIDLGDAPLPCIQDGEAQEFTIVPEIVGVDQADLDMVQYEWSTGETTPTISVSESGTYSLTTTLNGCEEFDEVVVQFVQAHQVMVPSEIICFDDANLSISSGYTFENADEIIWQRPDGSLVEDQSTLNLDWNLPAGPSVAENEIVGEYMLTVVISECSVSTTFDVDFRRQGPASSTENTGNIIESCTLPQGISPNGDGINDCFDLSFLAENPGIAKLQIFNRYGRKVFESTDYTNEFCGQDDGGNNLVTGTYFYVLELTEASSGFDRVEKGWVYINREQQ